ncbi:VOC family protein [Myxococcus sp. K38C18041901]|uniref:VOC family protein n=1 Tax=Myxococcus guangdongensis TaxID=2906760 RepID=UPI0020A71BEC|nr:VOC family protein [Myxococcus guangdongensis]MCP3058212.1 VOC family protein [Myxococcus guangdongensis]
MMQLDHLAVDARDVDASSWFLARILGAKAPVPEGADDDMRRIDLDHGCFVLFSHASEPRFSHVAFRVDPARFTQVVARLQEARVPFGNEPFDTANGQTQDPLGGAGRVYFQDGNGHLWEVTC